MYKKQKMLKIKKFWLLILWIIVFLWFNFQYTRWLATREHNNSNWSQNEDRPSDWKFDNSPISDNPIWDGTTIMWEKSKWILHVPQPEEYSTKLWYTMSLIKIIINRTLGMLAFIALIYILYNWFLILAAWSDDKNATKWKSWIKTAIIAITWIWISWMIISAIIRLIGILAKTN